MLKFILTAACTLKAQLFILQGEFSCWAEAAPLSACNPVGAGSL